MKAASRDFSVAADMPKGGQFILSSRGRDKEFTALYDSSFATVRKVVFAFCGDIEIAQDAAQEAFVRAYSRWGRLRGEGWIEGWLVTTAMNEARRHLKREGAERVIESPSQKLSSAPSPEAFEIAAAFGKLPFKQRQVAIMFFVLDLPQLVIADCMNISQGTVKAHVAQAREKLKVELGEGIEKGRR